MNRKYSVYASLLALSAAATARAEVVSAAASGFEVRESAYVTASPTRAFDVFAGHVGQWWNAEHTFSGNPANLSIQTFAGGCFCERLADGGSVEHLHVVFVRPGIQLSMTGGMGPLQSMGFAGVLKVVFTAQGSGTNVVLTYRVHGYDPKGADPMALPVDGMLSETLKRFQRFVDGGDPEPASTVRPSPH